MKKIFKRITALLIAATLPVSFVPTSLFAEETDDTNLIQNLSSSGVEELSDGYISLKVSADNGGFLISTVEGNKLEKSDDNKDLLYPSSDYDTSYTSIRVTRTDGSVEDYIFGRDYNYKGIECSEVELSKLGNSIIAKWSVGDITVTQTLGLLDESASQHGMVSIDYAITTQSDDIDNVKVRIMLDTSLGEQDYGYYQLPNALNEYSSISNEYVLDNTSSYAYNGTFFAIDEPKSPKINAYTVDVAVKGEVIKPYQVAFAHWNSLASTIFDFVPNESINFTNQYNVQYATADSAYALYYDLGSLSKDETVNLSTYYGVYSNSTVAPDESVAINFTSLPASMTFNEDETGYVSQVKEGNEGDIRLQLMVENISAEKKNNVTLVVKTMNGVTPYLDWSVKRLDEAESDYVETRRDVLPGEELTFDMYFNITPISVSEYRSFEVLCYDAAEGEELTEGKLLGSRKFYLFCPGELGEIVVFNSISPQVLHYEGTRRLYLSGKNIALMKDTTAYTTILHPVAGGEDVVVPSKNVVVDTTNNSMYLVIDTEMVPGGYQVIFDWNEAGKENTTATALQFQVSDKPKYVAPTYGIVTIEKDKDYTDFDPKYTVGIYTDESDYKKRVPDPTNTVFLEFRGDFGARYDENGNLAEVKAASLTDIYDKVISTINISGCIDVEDGFVSVNIENYGTDSQCINVDIEGKVYTTNSRTTIWNGVCAITSFENGELNKLLQYKHDGSAATGVENASSNTNTIMLLWPGAASAAQTLAGVVFEFRYAQFGMIATEPGNVTTSTPRERVISFGAQMSPSFLLPKNFDWGGRKTSALEAIQLKFAKSNYTASQLRDVEWRYRNDQLNWREAERGTLNLYVDNILFGSKGFIGFNASIEVGIPSYTSGMPGVSGTLELKILPIMDYWEVGIEGEADFIALKMEAAIRLKQAYGGAPGVDKFYFYVEGAAPGINIDGFGVFWIKGLGGGIDNVYDTIYAVSKVPPISLLFSGKFSLFEVLDARADLNIGLRGFSVTLSELGVSGVTLVDRANFTIAWYPDLSLKASVTISILDIINGSGYIAVEKDDRTDSYFWEGYATASIQTPDLPVIGSVKIGSAALGVNTHKIWGALCVIGIDMGVTYYWGGDVDFGFGKYDSPEPTYPLALAATPVGVDEKTGNTIYMLLATNVEKLMGDGNGGTSITSSVDRMNHVIDLGNYKQSRDLMLTMTFDAESEAEAEALVKGDNYGNAGIVLKATDDESKTYPLTWLDNSKDVNGQSGTNALMFYNEETKQATVTISFTEAESYNHNWKLTVGKSAELTLYEMNKMAGIDEINYSHNNTDNEISLSWTGSKLDDIENLSVSAIDEDGNAYLIYETSDSAVICGNSANATNGTVEFEIPANLPSGTYELQVVGSSEANNVCDILVSDVTFTHKNLSQPEMPVISDVSLGGDYSIDANVTADDITDGYVVTVYEKQTDNSENSWVVSSLGAQYIEADETGELPNVITVGGQYDTIIYVDEEGNRVSLSEAQTREDVTEQTVTLGLEAGKTYKVGVIAYNQDDNGNEFFSKEVFSGEVFMKAPVKPKVEVLAAGSKAFEDKTKATDKIDYVTTGEVEILISSDMVIEGQWSLDAGAKKGTFEANNNTTIVLGDSNESLEDGEHSITLTGTNENGDSFVVEYRFYVKTTAPRLQLSSPYAGSFFSDTVKVTGLGDVGSKVYVLLDGKPYGNIEVDDDGQFEYNVEMDKNKYKHVISVYAENELGIQSYQYNITLINELVSAADVSLAIYLDGIDYTYGTIPAGSTGKLELRAVSGDESLVIPDNSLLGSQADWSLHVVEGTASINNMNLTTDEDVNGMLMVNFEGYDIATVIGGNNLTYNEVAKLVVEPEANDLTYTGNAQELVKAGITNHGTVVYSMEENGTYTASIPTGTNAGSYKVWYYVVADEEHLDSAKKFIDITIKTVSVDSVQISLPTEVTYNGAEQKPEVEVKFGDVTLVLGEDYALSYSDNTDVGVATVTISGKGNYSGSVEKTFAIIDRTKQVLEISYTYKEGAHKSATLELDDDTFEKLVNNDYVLVEGDDYTITEDGVVTINASYLDSLVPCEAPYILEAFVTPKNGEMLSLGVIKVKISKAADISSMEGIVMPEANIKVSSDSETLADVSLPAGWKWENETTTIKAGATITAKAIYIGLGCENYENVIFEVVVTKNHEVITLKANDLTYNGKAQLLVQATSIDAGTVMYSLTKDGSYIEDIPTAVNAGSYTVWYYVAGEVGDTDSAKASINVTIKKASIDGEFVTITLPESVEYTGLEQRPAVTVVFGDKNLIFNLDYTVVYGDNLNIGTATATVEGIGNFTGVVEKTFLIKEIPGKKDGSISYIEDLSKIYDGNVVAIPDIVTTNSTLIDGSIKVEFKLKSEDDSTYTTIAPKNAGEYIVRVTVDEDEFYKKVSKTVEFTITKAAKVSDVKGNIMPEATINVSNECDILGDVSLPTGWKWSNENTLLEAGKAVIVTAVYIGVDSENYEDVSFDVVVTRAEKEVVATGDSTNQWMYIVLLGAMLVMFCYGRMLLPKKREE